MEGPLVFDPGGVDERGGGVWGEEGLVLSATLGSRIGPACLLQWLVRGCARDPLKDLALGHWRVRRTRGVSLHPD